LSIKMKGDARIPRTESRASIVATYCPDDLNSELYGAA